MSEGGGGMELVGWGGVEEVSEWDGEGLRK